MFKPKNSRIKLLYVAQNSVQHNRDKIWIDSFRKKEITVSTFETFTYESQLKGKLSKFLFRFGRGKLINQMRCDLLHLIRNSKIDWIHFRLPLWFDQNTIMNLKNHCSVITCYYNDDPFSSKRVPFLHTNFIKSIPLYDAHFIFRRKNEEEFYQNGAKNVIFCPPFYSPKEHFPVNAPKNFNPYDIVFIGHWEDDNRLDYIIEIEKKGFRVKVAGPLWENAVMGTPIENMCSFNPVFGRDYSLLYSTAKIGLCFFSKINSDTWTRRPMEIVACGGLLVCERTDEAQCYFEDRKEAFFFSSKAELFEIIEIIFENPDYASMVRKAGIDKLKKGNHTIDNRVDEMISIVRNIN